LTEATGTVPADIRAAGIAGTLNRKYSTPHTINLVEADSVCVGIRGLRIAIDNVFIISSKTGRRDIEKGCLHTRRPVSSDKTLKYCSIQQATYLQGTRVPYLQ
jgi:hypothetical protein